MPRYALEMKATLNNLEEVRASPDPDFRWYFKFLCNNCGQTSEKFHYICLSECVPGRKRGATKNLEIKCKFCSRETSINILEDYIKPYIANDRDDYQPIAAFEFRGSMEPIEFSPRAGWIAKAIDGGTVFTEVDLTEEWSDYCEKIQQPVAIYELQFSITVCK